jgi:hypothetical protein
MKSTEEHIHDICDEIRDMLIEKNRAYGDSAVNPVRIFAKGMTVEQMINVRMDDKLSRLVRGDATAFGESPEKDLMGYLVLKRVAQRVEQEKAQANNGAAHPEAISNRTVTDQDIVTGAAKPHRTEARPEPEDDVQCIGVSEKGVRCRRHDGHNGPHRAGEGYNMVEWERLEARH